MMVEWNKNMNQAIRIVGLHALCEFQCRTCGVVCQRMTLVGVTPDGRIGQPQPIEDRECRCNDCLDGERVEYLRERRNR